MSIFSFLFCFFFFNDTATTEIYTFPYTTLFRSCTSKPCSPFSLPSRCGRPCVSMKARRRPAASRSDRSEEHTSELQSQSNLVCRLLLEKKKKEKEHLCILIFIEIKLHNTIVSPA